MAVLRLCKIVPTIGELNQLMSIQLDMPQSFEVGEVGGDGVECSGHLVSLQN